MRNPNGYGSVVRLPGNRRRPWMVRITSGYRDNGTPMYKALDYFSRREDAMIFLADYNDNPYEVDARNITMSELFKKLQLIEFPKMSNSLQATLKAAYKHCERLHGEKYRTIKKYQMQACIDSCGLSYATRTHIKNLFYHLDRIAFEMDVITKRRSETLTVPPANAKQKTIFTKEEIAKLWEHEGEPGVDQILFMLYTGMRVSEMLTVQNANVDLENATIVGGMKTDAGKDRLIPIHEKIRPLVARNVSDDVYLFPVKRDVRNAKDAVAALKSSYGKIWTSVMVELGMEHTSHDCRHTFRSGLDSAGANKVCIDMLMGHKSRDIGERVYTHKTVDELREAVNLLSYDVSVSPRNKRVINK